MVWFSVNTFKTSVSRLFHLSSEPPKNAMRLVWVILVIGVNENGVGLFFKFMYVSVEGVPGGVSASAYPVEVYLKLSLLHDAPDSLKKFHDFGLFSVGRFTCSSDMINDSGVVVE